MRRFAADVVRELDAELGEEEGAVQGGAAGAEEGAPFGSSGWAEGFAREIVSNSFSRAQQRLNAARFRTFMQTIVRAVERRRGAGGGEEARAVDLIRSLADPSFVADISSVRTAFESRGWRDVPWSAIIPLPLPTGDTALASGAALAPPPPDASAAHHEVRSVRVRILQAVDAVMSGEAEEGLQRRDDGVDCAAEVVNALLGDMRRYYHGSFSHIADEKTRRAVAMAFAVVLHASTDAAMTLSRIQGHLPTSPSSSQVFAESVLPLVNEGYAAQMTDALDATVRLGFHLSRAIEVLGRWRSEDLDVSALFANIRDARALAQGMEGGEGVGATVLTACGVVERAVAAHGWSRVDVASVCVATMAAARVVLRFHGEGGAFGRVAQQLAKWVADAADLEVEDAVLHADAVRNVFSHEWWQGEGEGEGGDVDGDGLQWMMWFLDSYGGALSASVRRAADDAAGELPAEVRRAMGAIVSHLSSAARRVTGVATAAEWKAAWAREAFSGDAGEEIREVVAAALDGFRTAGYARAMRRIVESTLPVAMRHGAREEGEGGEAFRDVLRDVIGATGEGGREWGADEYAALAGASLFVESMRTLEALAAEVEKVAEMVRRAAATAALEPYVGAWTEVVAATARWAITTPPSRRAEMAGRVMFELAEACRAWRQGVNDTFDLRKVHATSFSRFDAARLALFATLREGEGEVEGRVEAEGEEAWAEVLAEAGTLEKEMKKVIRKDVCGKRKYEKKHLLPLLAELRGRIEAFAAGRSIPLADLLERHPGLRSIMKHVAFLESDSDRGSYRGLLDARFNLNCR